MQMPALPADAAAEWDALWAPIFERGEGRATVFTHRDYHAQNLLWLPERKGPARVGLLDFQDAVRAHPAWDLTHLLQDARRDVSPELETAMLARFLDARPGLDRDAFLADYRALAAANAARILGRVFARQVLLGRPQYRAFMPRTWRYLERNLKDPQLAGLRRWFDRYTPAEVRA
jgi:aminoglycoside/choline kinase family phosphotransferase